MDNPKDKLTRVSLMAGGAVMALAAGGYGQRANAQAAGCTAPVGAVSVCSGAVTDPIFLGSGGSLTIQLDQTFSLDTTDDVGQNGFASSVSQSLILTQTGTGSFSSDSTTFRIFAASANIDLQGDIYSANNIGLAAYLRPTNGESSSTIDLGNVDAVTGVSVNHTNNPMADHDITVNVTGDVTTTSGGIIVNNTAGTGDGTVFVNGSVSAGGNAVNVNSVGGEADIHVTGDVMSTTGAGVIARGSASSNVADAITIDVDGNIMAGSYGIDAYNMSYGAIRIYTAGDVTTTSTNKGVSAISSVQSGTIDPGGTYIYNDGTVSATRGNGVSVYRDSGFTYGVNVQLNDVNAGQDGVSLTTGSGFTSNVSVNNVMAGNDGVSLFATSGAPNQSYVGVNGEIVSGRYDVYDQNGSTTISLNEGGSLTGDVSLGSQRDVFNLNGGDMTGAGAIYGGDDPSQDFILVSSSSDIVGTKLQEFESIFVGNRKKFIKGSALPDPVVGQFAQNDTLSLDGNYGQASVAANGILSSGDNLTINAAYGVSLNGPQRFYRYNDATMTNELIGSFDGGILRTGGAPGGSSIIVNSTGPGQGINGSGTIDMLNGAVGDGVQVNGGVFLYGPQGADVLRVDIDPAVAEGDLLTVRDDVYLSGNINVNVINITETGVTDHVVVRTTDGSILEPGAPAPSDQPQEDVGERQGLTASTDSVAAEVEARIEENEVIVQVTTDFTPPVEDDDPEPVTEDPDFNDTALSDNGFTFGEYLNQVLNDPALADVRELALAATSIEELEALYQRLNGTDFHAPLFSSFQGGTGFGAGLFSCAVGEGQFAAIDEGQCGWTRISGLTFDRDSSPGNPGVDETIFGVSVGGQLMVDENIRVGGGLGFETVDSDGDGGLDFDGDRIHAGVSAKYVDGNFMAGVSIGGGVTFGDTERAVGGGNVAEASFDTYDFSVLARAAYLAELGDGVYVKPQIQGGVTYVDRQGFTETGGGAANLQVLSEDQTFLSFSPSIEIGGDFEMDGGMKVRPYLRVGATILSEDDVDTTARFAASASNATFTTTVARDDVFGQVNAGVLIFSDEDLSIRAEYQGQFSDDTESHGGFLKVQINF